MSKFWKFICIVEFLIAIVVWMAVLESDQKFHLVTCNVGQGDAILAVYQNTEILVDGGPDRKVLDCLGKYLPFWDRTIELVILTHPEKDHYGGLVDVFKRYHIDNFMFNDLKVSNPSVGSPDYQALISLVGGSVGRVIRPLKGQHVRLGLMSLDILNPDGSPKKELNLYSVVAKLHFGSFSSLLTGDIPNFTFGAKHHVQYIKVPHHGSKNGLTASLLEETTPDLAVISVGVNTFGHPSPEILQMLNDYGVKYLRTDQMGDVEVISDGKTWKVK